MLFQFHRVVCRYIVTLVLCIGIVSLVIDGVAFAQTSGLVASYAFNEGSGNITADASGNNNTGALNGATWTAQGQYGNALSFNGTTNRVTVVNSASLQAPTIALTVSVWVRPNGASQAWSSIIHKVNASNHISYAFGQNAGNTRRLSGYLQVNGVEYTTPMTNALVNQTWYYVVLSWQSGQPLNLAVYNANGSLFDTRSTSQAPSGSINYDASPLYFGEDEAGDNWKGTIDNVRIYNRLLSAAEIQNDRTTPVSVTSGDPTAPTAPTNLAATTTSSNRIDLNWTASTDNVGVTGYQIERCQGAGCTTFTQVATPTGTTYSDPGLTANTSYSYRVRATDAAGNLSPYSTTASATTQVVGDTTAPTVPTNLTATTTSSNRIDLSWTAATDNVGVAGYQVERCQGAGCTTFTQVATPTGTNFSDPSLAASTTYSYRVRAADAAGNLSGYSTTANITTQGVPPPNGGLVAAYNFNEGAGTVAADVSGNSNTGTLSGASWEGQGKFGGALLFDGVNDIVLVNDSPSLDLASAMTLEAWVHPTVAPLGWKAILQKEVDAYLLTAGSSAGTPAVGVTLNGVCCTNVYAQTALALNSWTHVAGTYDGAVMQLYINGALVTSGAAGGVLETNTNPLRIGGNTYGGEYFAGRIDEVRIYNRVLSQAEIQTDMNTPVGSMPTPDTTAPTTPSNVSATAVSSNQINLSWTAATDNVGVTGYQVERCQGAGCIAFTQVATATSTTYSDPGLTANTSYSYRVRATDAAVNFSPHSTIANATTQVAGDTTPPTAPTNLTATATSSSQINLSWTASTDDVAVSGYQIERCQGAGCTTFTQVVTPTGTNYSDTNLAASTTYSYRVRATDVAGNLSGYSTTANITTQGVPPPNGGLVAAYNFNEGAGTTTADASGNNNTGTVNGASWEGQGKFGGALLFDGVNDLVLVNDSSSLDLASVMTLEAWVYPTVAPSGWKAILQKEVDAYFLTAGSSVGTPAVGGTLNGVCCTVVQALAALAANSWTHVAGTYDGAVMRLYINGVLVTSGAASGALETNANPLRIGGNTYGDEYFQGRIDEVRIYNRALSVAEIQTDMNTPVGGTPTPDTTPPTVPSNLTTTAVSSSQINLSWTAATDNVGVTGYQVERCQGAGCTTFTQVATATGTTYSDPGLSASTSYSYRVRAMDAAGNLSPYSNVTSAVTVAPDLTPPTAPSNLAASASTVSQINLSWTASIDNVGVTGYRVERCQGAGCANFTQVATPVGTTYGDTGLSASTSYSYRVRAADGEGNLSGYSNTVGTTTFSATPDQVGQWGEVFNWPIVAVHAALLPTGKVLAWDYDSAGQGVQLWNPTTNAFTAVPYNPDNLFCAGLAALRDGRVLVAGGHVANYVGITGATIFNPTTQTWSATTPMAFPRWYPTVTTLPDGRVLVTSGAMECHNCNANTPEVYNPTTGTWTQLTNATLALSMYPHMFVLPDGRVLVTGSYESYREPVIARVLDLNTQIWTTVDPVPVNGGSAAMYLPGKVVTSGLGTEGGADVTSTPSTATTYVLDMTQPAPAWRQTAPMAFPRDYHNLTLLPDGTVLVIGGGRTTGATDPATAVFEAELWSPVTEAWTTLSRMQVPRRYHSTALLLPDGRVLVAGGGRNNGVGTPTNSNDHLNAEIFSPPYLFKGTRPSLTSAPVTLQYGANFSVVTPDASRIALVSLIRLGAVTHAFNMDQRFLKLTFQQVSGGLTVQAPANANLAPPGYYMLFLVDGSGVPSTAAIVQFP